VSATTHGSGLPALITGGAGFIGANLAHRLLSAGERVVLFDNLSRPGSARNLSWLTRAHGDRVTLINADVRDAAKVAEAVRAASMVFHFAAQVAVTHSLLMPEVDFEINARGTLNVLSALRAMPAPPPLLFTSTNKVYGPLEDIVLRDLGYRVEPEDPELRGAGISEARSLDLQSPYGCSKGTADQYTLEYARAFNLSAVVFRMSCIYGPRQLGSEDQGWVAHFLIQAQKEEPINLYGDGTQVRDVLFIDDLVDAFLLARSRIREIAGMAFNIGGGPSQAVSLLEVIELISALEGRRPELRFARRRPSDQRYYVSDNRRFATWTGWSPRVAVREGVARLHRWLREAPFPREAAVAPLEEGR
jgi:CDP-paratose 2-epimerase